VNIETFKMERMQSTIWPIGPAPGSWPTRSIRERSVLLVPGDHFDTDGFLRFGYGPERDYLLKGLAGVEEILKKYL